MQIQARAVMTSHVASTWAGDRALKAQVLGDAHQAMDEMCETAGCRRTSPARMVSQTADDDDAGLVLVDFSADTSRT